MRGCVSEDVMCCGSGCGMWILSISFLPVRRSDPSDTRHLACVNRLFTAISFVMANMTRHSYNAELASVKLKCCVVNMCAKKATWVYLSAICRRLRCCPHCCQYEPATTTSMQAVVLLQQGQSIRRNGPDHVTNNYTIASRG